METESCIYIDDYAHHPQEISAALTSIKGNFPQHRLTAIFQPHLYTRTRDFADGFAEALSKVDRLILLDIYPAREEPIPGVTSQIIFDKVTAPERELIVKSELMDHLRNSLNLCGKDVIVTMGAGDIDRLVPEINKMLNEMKTC